MSVTATDICNLGISHLGAGATISNLRQDQSPEAKVCRLFYDIVLDKVLRETDWNFATRVEPLNLIEENPSEEWGYSYAYPSNCIRLRRILSGLRSDNKYTRVPYSLYSSDGGRLIYTDKGEAEVEFTYKAYNEAIYPAEFTLGLSYLIAFYIAPTIVSNRLRSVQDALYLMYKRTIGEAMAQTENEQRRDVARQSTFITARNRYRDQGISSGSPSGADTFNTSGYDVAV